MKIGIKKFDVEMELKTKGIELEVRDNNEEFLGDLRIGKATIEWCQGRTRQGNGVQKSWDELLEFFSK